MVAAQGAVATQRDVVKAKHAVTLANGALYQAAMQDEISAQNKLSELQTNLNGIQMQMFMQNCPFQPGQA